MKMPKDKLEELSTKYNPSKNQCQFLYELLNGDMELYVELEDAIKYLMLFYCPGDLNECNLVLARYRVNKHINKLYESAIHKRAFCRLKGTNIFGIINLELDDHWGIYWFSYSEGKEYGDAIRKTKGYPQFWWPKTEIERISTKEFHKNHEYHY